MTAVIVLFVATISVGLVLFKTIVKLNTRFNRSATCLVGKTAIVTGSNTGIGYYTALDFAKRGARVILACRNKEKAERAKNTIIKSTGNSNVIVKIVDFASLKSVREFAEEINKTEERLDILINNAGVLSIEDTTTIDGFSILTQVNYLAPFLLTLLLINLMKKSTPSRIVNVSSASAKFQRLDPNNIDLRYKFQFVHYANTKLCNMLFTNELARKLKGSGVVANSLNPGVVGTDIFNTVPFPLRTMIRIFGILYFKTPKEGAQTSIYLAVSKDVEGVTGEYFENCRIAWFPPMIRVARNEGLAKKVWEKSEEMVKLSPEEMSL